MLRLAGLPLTVLAVTTPRFVRPMGLLWRPFFMRPTFSFPPLLQYSLVRPLLGPVPWDIPAVLTSLPCLPACTNLWTPLGLSSLMPVFFSPTTKPLSSLSRCLPLQPLHRSPRCAMTSTHCSCMAGETPQAPFLLSPGIFQSWNFQLIATTQLCVVIFCALRGVFELLDEFGQFVHTYICPVSAVFGSPQVSARRYFCCKRPSLETLAPLCISFLEAQWRHCGG